MLGLAVHLETHLRDRPFAERWRASRSLGYAACEFNWRRHDAAEAAALRAETGLTVACLGGTTSGRVGGEAPSLVMPGDRERLAEAVRSALESARAVACRRLVMVLGNRVDGWNTARHRAEVVASLRGVAPALERAGVVAVLEPLNTRVDHPRCWCDTSAEAFAVVEAVGSPAVRVLYDIYHMQVMGDDVVEVIRRRHALIGHYHIAGVPGRNEPLGGELDGEAVFEAIAATGYDGFVGLEYRPAVEPEESLRRVRAAYPDRDPAAEILKTARRVAVVGISPKPERPSHEVALYLRGAGYEVVPVRPGAATVLGETCYARLEDVPGAVDVVDVFRRSEEVPAVVDAAIRIGAKALWLQEGVVHEEAGERARAAGLAVVMDRCIAKEHRRLRADGRV